MSKERTIQSRHPTYTCSYNSYHQAPNRLIATSLERFTSLKILKNWKTLNTLTRSLWNIISPNACLLNTLSLIYVTPDLSLNSVTSQYMGRSKPATLYFLSVLVISWIFWDHMQTILDTFSVRIANLHSKDKNIYTKLNVGEKAFETLVKHFLNYNQHFRMWTTKILSHISSIRLRSRKELIHSMQISPKLPLTSTDIFKDCKRNNHLLRYS